MTKLQKAISVINQAYRMSYSEVGEATAEEAQSMGATAYFEKYWKPYIKTVHICINNVDCGYSNNNPFDFKNGVKDTTYLTDPTTRTAFYTPDGYVYIIFTAYYNSTIPLTIVFVDLNGGKSPNKFGYDVFELERVVDSVKGGYVRLYGQQEDFATVNENCISGNGEYCAEKIRRDGWQIKDDYGW